MEMASGKGAGKCPDSNFYDGSVMKLYCIVLYCLYLYPGFYSYTEGATWKILDLFNGDPPHLTLNHGFQVIPLSRPKKVA